MTLSELLKRVDVLKTEIDDLRPIDPDQEQRIMQKFRLDLTYHSNAIEGNKLTSGETKAFLLYDITAQGKPPRDYLDIKGHHAALDHLLEIVRQQIPLNEAAVRELHKIILVEPYDVDAVTKDGRRTKRRITPGQYKSMPNHVETSTGEMHYYASPEETPAKMADLMAWYHRESDKGELPALILAATFHYQFVTIHPFDDGNGRMARLLMNLIFMQAGFPLVIIPLDIKNEYLLALEKADEDHNLEPFNILVGKVLIESLSLYLQGAKGEDIEDIGDLDKKLAILQKRLDADKKELGFERTPATLLEFHKNLLAPFLRVFLSHLCKFEHFFHKSKIELTHDNHRRDVMKDELLPFIKNLLSKNDINKLRISYQLDKFKTKEAFRLFTILHIHFQQFKFEISYQLFPHNPGKILLSGKYDSIFSNEELEKIILTISNEIYDLVERNVTKL